MSDSKSNLQKFYGKYRGTVVQNVDPEFRGRLMCEVPDVLGLTPSSWCEACAPLSGPTGPPMGIYCVPPIGAGVWVEFEQGDPNKPIWSGCRWPGLASVPPAAKAGLPADPNIVIQSLLQNMVMISDLPPSPVTGGIVLKSSTGLSSIVVNDSGIYITSGAASIQLVEAAITINNGAMVII
jgi:hypothetical protein